jgi:hypothetical protein
VYTLVGDSLVAHRVRTGITDGTRTEVSGKTLTKDLVIVIGSSTGSGSGASSSGSTTASPFQQSRTTRQPGPPTPF